MGVRIAVRLPAQLLRAVDEEARRRGVTRAEEIRHRCEGVPAVAAYAERPADDRSASVSDTIPEHWILPAEYVEAGVEVLTTPGGVSMFLWRGTAAPGPEWIRAGLELFVAPYGTAAP